MRCRRWSSAAWRTAHLFKAERGSAAAWILTLLHRRAVDAVRREEWRRPHPLDDEAAEPDAGSGSGVDAIALAYYGGLTQSQIAERLGTALATVKRRTFTGMKRLEQALAAA